MLYDTLGIFVDLYSVAWYHEIKWSQLSFASQCLQNDRVYGN